MLVYAIVDTFLSKCTSLFIEKNNDLRKKALPGSYAGLLHLPVYSVCVHSEQRLPTALEVPASKYHGGFEELIKPLLSAGSNKSTGRV